MTNKPSDELKEQLPGAVEVHAIDYRSLKKPCVSLRQRLYRRAGTFFLLVVGIILLSIAVFAFIARSVNIGFEPEPDSVELRGFFLRPKIGDNLLLLPGRYQLVASKSGYRDFDNDLIIDKGGETQFLFTMTPLPGRLSVKALDAETKGPLTGSAIFVDATEIGRTPIEDYEIEAGSYRLNTSVPRYLPYEKGIEIGGRNIEQRITVELNRAWAVVSVPAAPVGAIVYANGVEIGAVPIDFEQDAGTCEVTIRKARYKTWSDEFVLESGETKVLPAIELQPLPGHVRIQTEPAGAQILLNAVFKGLSPLKAEVAPDAEHEIKVIKAGYHSATRRVNADNDEELTVIIPLKPRLGVVELEIIPADAEVTINNVVHSISGPVSLPAIEQIVVVRKPEFATETRTITPQVDYPQSLRIELRTIQSSPQYPKTAITTGGYKLVLIEPTGVFTVGSPRNEPNRLPNETPRKVKLERPFMMGTREVTNGEFRLFDLGHRSGEGLDADDQPVVNIKWAEAGAYCNWLSEKEDLPRAYIEHGEKLVMRRPFSTGYRLPTEAEWEYSARSVSPGTGPYPWGKTWPPESTVGNLGDQSAAHLGINVLNKYNDGFERTAPVGSFKADGNGLFDMVGNVAEWCNDYYGIYNYEPDKVVIEPVGPEHGVHHIIRGSSWRYATKTKLRIAHRQYNSDKEDFVGFRVCRYLSVE